MYIIADYWGISLLQIPSKRALASSKAGAEKSQMLNAVITNHQHCSPEHQSPPQFSTTPPVHQSPPVKSLIHIILVRDGESAMHKPQAMFY